MGLQTIVSRSEKILHTDVDGDITMMSIETGRYYALSAVGARIWALIEQPASASQICDRLMAEYRIDRPRCEDEVLRFLDRMAGEGVVVIAREHT